MVSICIRLCFVRVDGYLGFELVDGYCVILYLILLLYYILYYTLLFFCSILPPLLPHPNNLIYHIFLFSSSSIFYSPHSFYTCRYLHILIYILLIYSSFPILFSHLLFPNPNLTPHVLSEWMVEVCGAYLCGVLVEVCRFELV